MVVEDVVVETTTVEERAWGYRDYVEALEEERRKIQVFQRELPLSLRLVTQTIDSCRQRMAGGGCRSEADEEETSCEGGPILEEFIPIKRRSSPGPDQGEEDGHRPEQISNATHHEEDSFSSSKRKNQDFSEKKPDWLRSVQLWSPLPDPHHDEDDETSRQSIVADRNKVTSAFHPFLPQKRSPPLATGTGEVATAPGLVKPAPAVSCTSDGRGKSSGSGGEDKDAHPNRKARRCWSPDLHRRFLDALQQLGGSHVATPKQIRDLMKVEGLTNDEVKSHLQKFRLHSRRPSPAMSHSNAANAPPHQVVFLGGLWVPPPEYAAAAAAAAAHPPPLTEGMVCPPIYAPVASLPMLNHQQQQAKQPQRSPSGPLPNGGRGTREDQRGVDDGATRSNSPATSSSSHTTSASHFNRHNIAQSC
ncbi:unnamed protein product [Spirodela intermedia]|uniref:HTH myb-type domain-containing protein n=1 Tax=Spirodela intermedia TaxID=51605 RepID=A0A7I8JNL1_SPIIN|nr:unnamed protein product [Spirodela intermedia]CAA6671365.1 unnamed protein product [Spirodela intermedia]